MCPLAVGLFVKLSGGKWQFVLPLFVGNYIVAALCWALLNPNGSFEEQRNESHFD